MKLEFYASADVAHAIGVQVLFPARSYLAEFTIGDVHSWCLLPQVIVRSICMIGSHTLMDHLSQVEVIFWNGSIEPFPSNPPTQHPATPSHEVMSTFNLSNTMKSGRILASTVPKNPDRALRDSRRPAHERRLG